MARHREIFVLKLSLPETVVSQTKVGKAFLVSLVVVIVESRQWLLFSSLQFSGTLLYILILSSDQACLMLALLLLLGYNLEYNCS